MSLNLQSKDKSPLYQLKAQLSELIFQFHLYRFTETALSGWSISSLFRRIFGIIGVLLCMFIHVCLCRVCCSLINGKPKTLFGLLVLFSRQTQQTSYPNECVVGFNLNIWTAYSFREYESMIRRNMASTACSSTKLKDFKLALLRNDLHNQDSTKSMVKHKFND